ncbi:MAG: enolase C-terminal domain-like protein, partial [Thermaurantiacus sp.]
AAALQLFATVPVLQRGTEFIGPLQLTEDILAEPLHYQDFTVAIPQGPGIGVALDADKVAFYRRDRTRIQTAIAGQ